MSDFKLGDGMKKILLAGVGAVATSAEKSQEILDELVKKGELTVEQGKALNQELKHTVKEAGKKAEETAAENEPEKKDIKSFVESLSAEELEELKKQIENADKE